MSKLDPEGICDLYRITHSENPDSGGLEHALILPVTLCQLVPSAAERCTQVPRGKPVMHCTFLSGVLQLILCLFRMEMLLPKEKVTLEFCLLHVAIYLYNIWCWYEEEGRRESGVVGICDSRGLVCLQKWAAQLGTSPSKVALLLPVPDQGSSDF